MAKVFDLLIVGGGVTGSALLYLAARYTDIGHIGMLEKYAAPARVNSLHSNNCCCRRKAAVICRGPVAARESAGA